MFGCSETPLSRSRIALRCCSLFFPSWRAIALLTKGERLEKKKALWYLHCQSKHVECNTKGFHSAATVTSSCSLKTQRKNQYCANGALCPSTPPPIRPFILSFLSQFGEFCLHSDRLHFYLPSAMAKVCIAPALQQIRPSISSGAHVLHIMGALQALCADRQDCDEQAKHIRSPVNRLIG